MSLRDSMYGVEMQELANSGFAPQQAYVQQTVFYSDNTAYPTKITHGQNQGMRNSSDDSRQEQIRLKQIQDELQRIQEENARMTELLYQQMQQLPINIPPMQVNPVPQVQQVQEPPKKQEIIILDDEPRVPIWDDNLKKVEGEDLL